MGGLQFSQRVPHPLEQLSIGEANRARDIVLQKHVRTVVDFRTVSLEEPLKAQLQPYLDAENAGTLSSNTPRPARQARIAYDVVSENKRFDFYESVVDVSSGEVVSQELIDQSLHAPLTLTDFDHLVKAVWDSKLFQDALAEFQLPEGFNVVVEPWPYGGRASDDENKRYFQGLCFAQDTRNGNPDSNFYAFPLPLIPIMDARKREIIRVERLATGGKEDGLVKGTHVKEILKHCKPAEYVPELLGNGTRKDLKPLNVIQPDGASFTVTDESLVEWQKWRFRVGFNSREGATIHDVRYDGRSVAYRIGVSEMTVPYADAREPMHRKQAFDFGDGGAGSCANNLSLGCDCLGHIKYFNSINMTGDGSVSVHPNVICLHEQDNGIGWKHTNWRTGRAVVTRYRELVVQFIITLANYEYVFSYHFDQAGAIMIETRATGIVSCVNIDPGKTSEYGNVVANGVLAQNHQHIFAVRLDPAIDGSNNTAVIEESHSVPTSEERNPRGNFYEVRQTPITKSSGHDAAPQHNRLIRLINPNKKNPISGKPVSYKFTPPPTQKLLAQPGSVQERRAQFCRHHVWITKYKDHELYAGGRYTLQSSDEIDGVSDAAKRNDDVENTDIVLWSCFGLTHNPRVEDWPVMPVEIFQLHFKPSDFFTENPALDVPSDRNLTSKLHDEKEGGGVVRDEKKDMVACCKL
ncbi:copper amine oxidase-like protein [Amylocarpus encephaloides]|uniref:Amine oxidase n=1 Tax=Amylocarpus encephaloides TaxID=45428 RepID=A0A9P8C4W3_9HELO|nr:copper amine oxidase-like protein [Amylocarpus encephaloides]